MITNAIARRYAKALIELADGEDSIESIYAEMTEISSLIQGHRELRAILSSPAYPLHMKNGMLKEIALRAGLSPTLTNFLLLLTEANRLRYLPSIIEAYRGYADERSGILRPTVTSPLPLDDAQVAGIRQAMERCTGKKIELNVEYDPSLIGGIVAQIGDRIYNGSISTQLEIIQDILQKG